MSNMKISHKIYLAFALVVALMIALSFYMGSRIEKIHEQDEELYEIGLVPMSELIEVSESMQEMRVHLRDWKNAKREEERVRAIRGIDERRDFVLKGIDKQLTLTRREDITKAMNAWKAAVEKYAATAHYFIRNSTEFCASSGMNTQDFTPDLEQATKEMGDAQDAAVAIKIKASEGIKDHNESIAHEAQTVSKVAIAVVLLLSIGICFILVNSIVPPLRLVSANLTKIEGGDMTVRTSLNHVGTIGRLSSAADSMASNMQKIFTNLRVDSDSVASASEELSAVSRQLASGAEETVNQCTTVSGTTGAMATNINAMASGAEQASASASEVANSADQMSDNMGTIAAAIEQMSASISEIANNTADVHRVATGASTKATEATAVMSTLGAAAKEIGQVTDVIKKIADKTNLLALNATIEAASAGEAGKGFAVVAGEIKELANQSAKSADDIAQRIEGIQNGTSNAVNVINEVSGIIENINSSVKVIAAHVDEQTKASNEIANSVAQANASAKQVAKSIGDVAKGANDVSHNAAEAARGASEVSNSTHEMIKVAAESAQGATHVNQSAGELAKIAADLKKVISRFRI